MGHLVPDVMLGALHKALPDTVPAERASALWSIQISARPSDSELRRVKTMISTSTRYLTASITPHAVATAAVSAVPVRLTSQKGTMLQSNGRRLIRNGQRLKLSLPGSGGYRDPEAGFIMAERAKRDYGFEE